MFLKIFSFYLYSITTVGCKNDGENIGNGGNHGGNNGDNIVDNSRKNMNINR